MREIKFRGLKTNGKGWAYGNLHKGENIRGEIYYEVGYGHNYYKVLPESVGQFTGLKDKNGVDIYEGDTIGFLTNNEYSSKPVSVKYTGSSFVAYNPECCDVCKNGCGCISGLDECIYMGKEIEVIGNIHENQELVQPISKQP